jgi:dihydroxy-acid dehydratase
MISLDVDRRELRLDVPDDVLAERRHAWKPRERQHLRGYPRLYADHVLQPDEGCDFDFLRPESDAALAFVPPVVGRS